jgi:alkaline phosphatase
MKRALLLLVLELAGLATVQAAEHAKNVILFLTDGNGPSTWNAASIYAYGRPQALYVQTMPHLGMSDTSSTSSWVTDSAAGMTAIVTGEKTDNAVISLVSPTTGGARAGQPLKTLLEYAEEHGLSTGVLSNSPMWDATPAACYAHSTHRRNHGDISAQILRPRFGDGVDLVIGPGRGEIIGETAKMGIDFAKTAAERGYLLLDNLATLTDVPTSAARVLDLWETESFDLETAVNGALAILSRNPKGFFLMVESDCHGKDARHDLERAVAVDKVIRSVTERYRKNSLILVTSDHSYDLRLWPGTHTKDILPFVHIEKDGDHTAEEVYAFADGPGSEQVHGFFPNTHLFDIMMDAFGWKPDSAPRQR